MANKNNLEFLGTDVFGVKLDKADFGVMEWNADEAATNDADGVMAAVHGATAEKTVTEDLVNPPACRNLTVTAGGTAADIAAGDVVVYGKNIAGEDISEAFTFAENTAATKTGAKCFKTVEKVVIPAQDGTGCTFTVGFGSKFGVPFKFKETPFALGSFNHANEAVTFTVDDDEIEKNCVSFTSSLSGKVCKLVVLL